MTATNKWYSYLRVTVIQIDVHPIGENPNNMILAFLSHRIICKRTYANCSIHPRVLKDMESTGKQ
jgi:hypothetical protein